MLMTMYAMPPNPTHFVNLNETGEICSSYTTNVACYSDRANMSGLGDPFGITDLASGVLNFMAAKRTAALQKQTVQLQAKQVKDTETTNARQFAMDQAKATADESKFTRDSQMIALAAIGGIAALITIVMVSNATKRSKD